MWQKYVDMLKMIMVRWAPTLADIVGQQTCSLLGWEMTEFNRDVVLGACTEVVE